MWENRMPQKTGSIRQKNQFQVNNQGYVFLIFELNVHLFILDKILASKDRMNELVSHQSTRVEELHELNAIMRNQLAIHHQLMSDVRSVLKIMAKVNISFTEFCRHID